MQDSLFGAATSEGARLRGNFEVVPPYELIATDERYPMPQEGIALCLSGGGYKAMLFHLGAVLRLNELGLLPKLARITSVSGGSLLAAYLGLRWKALKFDSNGVAGNLDRLVARPIRRLASTTMDKPAILFRILGLRFTLNYMRLVLEARLFRLATMQALPDHPRFVITAANVQSGALFRFMKPRLRDWRVGDIPRSHVRLSFAVMASAAYPPYLSPMVLNLQPSSFAKESGYDLREKEFRRRIFLTDAGVYDNLGIETAWKKYDTVFISDAGFSPLPSARPSSGWYGHIVRVFELVAHQSRKLRKRQVIESLKLRDSMREAGFQEQDPLYRKFSRKGAYWGIRSDIKHYDLDSYFDVPLREAQRLSELPVRLARMSRSDQARLIDWGYTVCDAALRRHFFKQGEAPASTPNGSFPRSEG